jgi:hypothetical protein
MNTWILQSGQSCVQRLTASVDDIYLSEDAHVANDAIEAPRRAVFLAGRLSVAENARQSMAFSVTFLVSKLDRILTVAAAFRRRPCYVAVEPMKMAVEGFHRYVDLVLGMSQSGAVLVTMEFLAKAPIMLL